jgi:hypothetical protein
MGPGRTGPGVARGGKGLALADQKAVGGDAQTGVVVEAAPAAALVMPEAELLLRLQVIPLDAPAQLGEADEVLE